MEQAVQHILRVQMQQFVGGECLRQGGNMLPRFGVGLFFGQALQQEAGGGFFVCRQGDVGFQLLGMCHVVHQHIGDAAAFQRHDALPRLAVFRLQGDGENALVAQKCAQWGIIGNMGGFVPACGGAQGVFGSGFHHQHFERALPLHLDDERAFGFQVARKQAACGQEFAQGAADGGGVMFTAEDVLPNFFYLDVQSADGHLVE